MIDKERAKFLDAGLSSYDYPFARSELTPEEVHYLLDHRTLKWLDLRGAKLHDPNHPNPDLGNRSLEHILLIGADLQKCILGVVKDCKFDGAHLEDAYLIGANVSRSSFEGAFMNGAHLNFAKLKEVKFTGARLRGAQIQSADARCSKRGGELCIPTIWNEADFEEADLSESDLRGAKLRGAKFGGCNLSRVRLEGADLTGAKLIRVERALRRGPRKVVALCGARLDGDTDLKDLTIADHRGWAPEVADVEWGAVNLTRITDLRLVERLGDETILAETGGKAQSPADRLEAHEIAVRANRQFARALRNQGLNAWALKFMYRARVLERRALRWRGRWSAPLTVEPPGPSALAGSLTGHDRLWSQLNSVMRHARGWRGQPARRATRWLGCALARMGFLMLGAVAGYGFKPGRSVAFYLGALVSFAGGYVAIAQHFATPSCPTDASDPMQALSCGHDFGSAFLMSVLSFHGRGLANGFDLQNPLTALAALEAVVGLTLEVTFIVAYTQRVFVD